MWDIMFCDYLGCTMRAIGISPAIINLGNTGCNCVSHYSIVNEDRYYCDTEILRGIDFPWVTHMGN